MPREHPTSDSLPPNGCSMPNDTHGGRSSAWAERAAALYDDAYAKRYRHHDDELDSSNLQLVSWLGGVCDRLDRQIDILHLGCGTGRDFWGSRRVNSLVGLAASAAMLEEARPPLHGDRLGGVPITLVRGDVMTQSFPASSFDRVYSIGVLAEHVPLDSSVVTRVHSWLRPSGRFAFTTVHPESVSVPRTTARRGAAMALQHLPAAASGAL